MNSRKFLREYFPNRAMLTKSFLYGMFSAHRKETIELVRFLTNLHRELTQLEGSFISRLASGAVGALQRFQTLRLITS